MGAELIENSLSNPCMTWFCNFIFDAINRNHTSYPLEAAAEKKSFFDFILDSKILSKVVLIYLNTEPE